MRRRRRRTRRRKRMKRTRRRSRRRNTVRRRMVISNEIWAAVVDHVLNHGLSMREAGQSVQPNLSRFTVAAIIRNFRMENRYEIYLPCVL